MALSRDDLRAKIIKLRDIVQKYKPGVNVTVPDKITFPENSFIGLYGRTGSGKSSLVNSLRFAAKGDLEEAEWIEVATQEKAGGHTMFRRIANMTKCIYVVDNRGLDNLNAKEAQAEMAAQLDGHRGYSEEVQWVRKGEQRKPNTPSKNDKKGHPISCAVFVFSAIHNVKADFAGLNLVVDFLHQNQGCYPIAVVTHVDVAERKNIDVLVAVLSVSGFATIYEVANITKTKTKLDEQYQLNLLTLIRRCMTIGDDTAVFKHYQREEKKMEEEARIEADKLGKDHERQKMKQESEQRDHDMKMEREKQHHELQMEQQKKELKQAAEERELRYQEQVRKMEVDKHGELMGFMVVKANGPKYLALGVAVGAPAQCSIQ